MKPHGGIDILTDENNRPFYTKSGLPRLVFTAGEMAAMCNCTPVTWSRWLKEGKAPQATAVEGTRWEASRIRRWLDIKD